MPDPQPVARRLACHDFMEGHGDYLDQVMSPAEAQVFDAHARSCPRCGNFDRVVRRGLLLARNLPELQPSPHFHEQLQARLMRLEDEPPQRPVVANTGTLVVIAAVLGFVALTPLFPLMVQPARETPAAVSPTALQPFPALNTFAPRSTAAVLVSDLDAYDFSPVIVQPPAVQLSPSAPRMAAYPLLQIDER